MLPSCVLGVECIDEVFDAPLVLGLGAHERGIHRFGDLDLRIRLALVVQRCESVQRQNAPEHPEELLVVGTNLG